MTTNIRQEVKSMAPRKLAMRFLTMGTAERKAKIREYFAGTAPATEGGVVWKAEGSFDGTALSVSYTASPDDSSTWITGGWIFLNNGTGDQAPALGCAATVVDGLQGTTDSSDMTGMFFLVPSPGSLQPIVVATLIAQLNNGEQSTYPIQISTNG